MGRPCAIAQHVKQAPVHPFVCTPLHSHCFVHGEVWCTGGGGGNPLSARWGVEPEGKQGEANPGQPQVKGVTQTLAAGSITCGLTLGPVQGKAPGKGPQERTSPKEKDKHGSSNGSKVEQKGSCI